MFEIGTSLRQARQHRGLELADVERETRIRAKYLGALEDDRFDVLPGTAYVRGFLRTYAEYLGLDGGIYVDEYNEQHVPAEDELPAIQHEPIGGGSRLRVARPLVGVALAAAAGVVVVWQLGFTTNKAVPQELTTTQVTIQPTATKKPAKSRVAGVTTTARAAGPATLVIRAARGDCWVIVRFGSSAGKVVYERTLAAGGTVRFGLGKPLWVRLGAPSHVGVTVRGEHVATPATGSPQNLTAA